MMDIKEWHVHGKITVEKDYFYFKGERATLNASESLEFGYKIGASVQYTVRKTKHTGKLIKINSKSVILENCRTKEIVKISFNNIVCANKYPNYIYRIQDKQSKVGPFQSKTNLSEETKAKLEQMQERIADVRRYPPPQYDSSIVGIFNSTYKFACASESTLKNWFREILDCTEFEVVALQEGWDFFECHYGNGQVIYK